MDGKFFWPGAVKDRKDTAEIPPGKKVDYQGPGTNELKGWMVLDKLIVNGDLRAMSAKTPIKITTEGPITVGSTGKVGGVSPGAGGKKKELPIHLASTKDTIGVHGKVEGENGSVSLTAKKNVTISGTVNSKGRGVKVESKSESVNITGGGIVSGDQTVEIQSGPGKPTRIYCRVESRKGDVEINGKRKKSAGDVYIGKGDSVIAAGEVVIRADSLHISGTIKGKTIKKYARVTVLDSTGSIQGKLKTKNKIDTVHVTQEKSDGRPAEKSNDHRITGMDGSYIDFRSSPSAVEAGSYCKIATGSGGTIDLRNNPPGWPVITCNGVIELFSDNILIDPGTPIESICGPGPVLTSPSSPAYDVSATVSDVGTGYPTMPIEVKFLVANMGNADDSYTITVTDALGWPLSVSDNTMTLDADDPMDSVVTVSLDVPMWAVPDIDTNYVMINVVSTTDPTVTYSETTYVAVRDTNMLRQNSVSWYDIESGMPGDTAEVYSLLMNINELVDSGVMTVNDSLGWELITSFDGVFLESMAETVFLTKTVIPGDSYEGQENAIYMEFRSVIDTATADFDTVRITVGEIPIGTFLRNFSTRYEESQGVVIEWEVGSTEECDRFTISRKTGGGEFEKLDDIAVEPFKQLYSYIDKDALFSADDVLTYRLEVTEKDGTWRVLSLQDVFVPKARLYLYQNYPNPFNPQTQIVFYLPRRVKVQLEIFDVSGRLISCLIDGEEKGPGRFTRNWNGLDKEGKQVASGIYYYRLRAGKESISRKMVILQ